MIAVCVTGHLGAEPELRYTPGGTAVLVLRVASNSRRQVDGEWRDWTTWVRVVVFGRRAEGLARVLASGSAVVGRGSLESTEYADREGVRRRDYEVRADSVELWSASRGTGRAPDTDDPPGWEAQEAPL